MSSKVKWGFETSDTKSQEGPLKILRGTFLGRHARTSLGRFLNILFDRPGDVPTWRSRSPKHPTLTVWCTSPSRPRDVPIWRPRNVRSGRLKEVRWGRPRDDQMRSLGDVLGTLEGWQYLPAGNRYLKSYDLKKESKHIYLGTNNLYGYATSKFTSTVRLKLVHPK